MSFSQQFFTFSWINTKQRFILPYQSTLQYFSYLWTEVLQITPIKLLVGSSETFFWLLFWLWSYFDSIWIIQEVIWELIDIWAYWLFIENYFLVYKCNFGQYKSILKTICKKSSLSGLMEDWYHFVLRAFRLGDEISFLSNFYCFSGALLAVKVLSTKPIEDESEILWLNLSKFPSIGSTPKALSDTINSFDAYPIYSGSHLFCWLSDQPA